MRTLAFSRRDFLAGILGGIGSRALGGCSAPLDTPADPFTLPMRIENRGVVLAPDDVVSLMDWPERAARAGINTIALHTSTLQTPNLVTLVQGATGKAFLQRCRASGVHVEYEVHAVGNLVPRSLFATRPELFRLDENCQRNPDGNICVHTPEVLEIAADSVKKLAQALRPTTGRYFFWGDDSINWCRCPCCKPLSDSDQALVLENRLIRAIREVDPQAQLAHLAYANTFKAPTEIKPVEGIFLEYAPYYRRPEVPLDTPDDPVQKEQLDALDANLAVFGAEGAQALEYWLDESKASFGQPGLVKLPWNPQVFLSDVATYHARGVRNITSFAVYLNAQYLAMYGEPPLSEYGHGLATMP